MKDGSLDRIIKIRHYSYSSNAMGSNNSKYFLKPLVIGGLGNRTKIYLWISYLFTCKFTNFV